MPIRFRRTKKLGRDGPRLNISKSGLSLSQRIGPATVSTSGYKSLRIAPGLSLFTTGRRKRRR